MNREKHSTSSSGMTLLEISLAIAIMTGVVIAVGKNFLDFSRSFSSLTKLMHSETRAEVVMDRLLDELITGSVTSLTPPGPIAAQAVEFRKITGIDGSGNALFSNPFHVELVDVESNTADGIDNDGNGLVDECGVRIWEDFPPYGPSPDASDNPAIICSKLTKDGLKFTQQDAVLLIEITVQEVFETGDPPKLINRKSGVRMRNN